MRLSKMALAGAILGLLSAGGAYAQSGWGQPSLVQQTAYEFNSYYYSQNEGAAPQAPASPAQSAPMSAPCDTCTAPSCGSSCCGSMCDRCCLGEQWKAFDNPCLACKGIKIEGWIAQSFTWNTSSPADRFNGPVTWTDRSNEYQLNQAYIYAEKATDTKGCGWDFGWRADVMAGTDYRFNTAAGLETRGYFQSPTVSTQRFYGTAFTQFYAEIAYNDWKVKVGHWYAPVGYEVVATTGNFFPNLPYTFQYGEPFTMTGALATYAINENSSFGVGIMHGWDNFDNTNNPHGSFVGTYTEKFCDGGQLALAWTVGMEPNQYNDPNIAGRATGWSQRFLQTAVYSRPLKRISDKLNYVVQSDFGYQNDVFGPGTTDAYWYGINQYLFYKVNDCLSYGIRAEWFRDQDGARVGGFLGTTPDGSTRGLPNARFGYPGSFYEVTFGAQYKINANNMLRPYVRFDWFSGSSPAPNLRPFDDGTGQSQTLIGADWVFTF